MSAERTARNRRWSDRLAGGVFAAWAYREHPGYARFRRDLERTQFCSLPQLEQMQRERLGGLLRHAAARCPFYRERLRGVGDLAAGRWDAAAWQSLPLLTKRDLQDFGSELEAEGYPPEGRTRNQTGGSTGSPVQYWVDRQRFATRMASTQRHDSWTGYRPGDWMATVWGAPLEAARGGRGWWEWCRKHLLYRSIELNTSSVGDGDWERFLSEVRRRRPRYLLAYASGAVELAERVRRQGIEDIRFDAIITSAEVLPAESRQTIESALGGRVYNRYGCREVSVIASECGEHAGLHVNAEALLVEIVPMAGVAAPWGKVVITDLLNRSMPLIRYEIGDVARWAEGPCPCGRGLPRLAEVQGRTADFLQLPDGRAVSGVALLTLGLADLSSVRQAQLVQRGAREIVLKVVPSSGYDAGARAELRSRVERYLQGSVPLRIEEVAAIAQAASGKYRFVVHESGAQEEDR
ncbi:MAG: phenylacetate--CoA ligase family protein [Terriglobales bacterium]